ncbi:MAG: NTP transferase domain-containing protein [Actinomycetaceae bacterium]|nr:NTP transferase domain-containing protein [Actinomycetaceae bacterium]MDY5854333.1 NTP transferase domain-containing protein [Arcanobacterium sp.]
MSQLSAAIVLAAGKGTRVKADTPKMLLDMCGRTLVGHVNAAISELHPEYTVFVVRHEREKIAEHIASIAPHALIADQDEIKGTGRAAWCAMQALPADLEGPVLVTAGDVPLLTSDTFAALAQTLGDYPVTMLTAFVPDPHGYGRVVREQGAVGANGEQRPAGAITAVVEEKDASSEQRKIHEINTSVYVFDAAFLRRSLTGLSTDNAQGEMYLTDLVALAANSGAGVGSYTLSNSVEAEGVNDLSQLASLSAEKRRSINDAWMRSGVKMTDPATVYIDVNATLEPNAVIEPNTIVRGHTHVGAYAHIGPCTTLTNVQVGEGATVPYAVIDGGDIPRNASISPFSSRALKECG